MPNSALLNAADLLQQFSVSGPKQQKIKKEKLTAAINFSERQHALCTFSCVLTPEATEEVPITFTQPHLLLQILQLFTIYKRNNNKKGLTFFEG